MPGLRWAVLDVLRTFQAVLCHTRPLPMGKAQQGVAAHGSSHSSTAVVPPVWPCLFLAVQPGVLERTPLRAVFLEGNYIMNDQKGELPSLAWICSETWEKSVQGLSDAAQIWVPSIWRNV